jgi:uncharacterized membrane protein (UPF0127 family)
MVAAVIEKVTYAIFIHAMAICDYYELQAALKRGLLHGLYKVLALSVVLVTTGACLAAGCANSNAAITSPTVSPTDPGLSASSDINEGPRVIFHGGEGDAVLGVEVARTVGERAIGLMNRSSLAADRGMIFVWNSPVREGFWMKNTLIPLSIAFVDTEGSIIDIQDMEPETLDNHTPSMDYIYAIEVNKGYFSSHGIKIGDQAEPKGI